MADRIPVTHVGAPDPEARNSPVVEETAEDFDVINQELPEGAVCYFNGVSFEHASYVCSGDELLVCNRGSWIRSGSCDPDNP